MYIHSPLNYTGGKYKLLQQLLPLFPQDMETFIDTFCGGCNVGINVNADKVVFNDSLTPLIDLYKVMKDTSVPDFVGEVDETIGRYGLSKTNQEGYLQLREKYNKDRNPVDLFVLIAYSFNNQLRFNSNMEFNMPFGKDRSSFNNKMRDNLVSFLNRIHEKDTVFLNSSYSDLGTDTLSEKDYVYCDPPYLITEATYNMSWTETDEKSLLTFLKSLDDKSIKFGLSNVLSHNNSVNCILNDRIETNGYNVVHLSQSYSNCSYHKKDKSSSSDEVFVCNYDIPSINKQLTLF